MAERGTLRTFKSYADTKALMENVPAVVTRRPLSQAEACRPGSLERGYSSDWTRLRESQLRMHPFCCVCGKLATMVDHIRAIKWGGSRRNPENLQSMCWHCHREKTVAEDAAMRKEGRTPLW